jgi:hypothetical protein
VTKGVPMLSSRDAEAASAGHFRRFIYAAFSPRSTFCSAGNVEPAVDDELDDAVTHGRQA